MRLLADESLDMRVIRALREAGHDVRSIAEDSPGSPDEIVSRAAIDDERVLLTEDRDFGRLVYAHERGSCGVVFLRYPARARQEMAAEVVKLVNAEGAALVASFVVMQPGRVRISRLINPEPQKG